MPFVRRIWKDFSAFWKSQISWGGVASLIAAGWQYHKGLFVGSFKHNLWAISIPYLGIVKELAATSKVLYRVEHKMGVKEDFIKIPDPINPKKEGTYIVIKLPKQPEAAKPQPMSPDNVTAMCASGKLSPALQTKYCSQK